MSLFQGKKNVTDWTLKEAIYYKHKISLFFDGHISLIHITQKAIPERGPTEILIGNLKPQNPIHLSNITHGEKSHCGTSLGNV